MKPARVFAGLTASTILTASLALTPQAVADPTTPTSGDDTGTAPTSPYNYAAIGDSATVAGSWFHPEKNLCGRNKKDYPAITASGTGLQLNEAACYNATSKNFQWTQPAGFGNSPNSPQIKAINKKTRLITIQLGLRDIVGAGPTSLFSKCAASWGKQYAIMASGKLTELTGGPCRDRYEKSTLEKFDGLESHLAALYTAAKAHAGGNALVVAIGYMPIFNGTNTCWDGAFIPPRDRDFYNTIYDKLNRTIRQAARTAGIYSLVVSKNLAVRSACGAPGMRFTTFSGVPEASYPMGPTVNGQAHIAATLEQMWKDWKSTHSSL